MTSKYDKKTQQVASVWNVSGVLADSIGGLICWSLMTHLPVDVFFYPCVKMAFTGWEIFLFSYAAPMLLIFPFLRRFTARFPGIFRLISLIGLCSFWIDRDNHEHRIGLGGVGLIFDLFGTFGLWVGSNKERRERAVFGFLIGNLLLLSIRLFAVSLNPIFLYPAANIAANVLGFLAAIYLFTETNVPEPRATPSHTHSIAWYRPAGIFGCMFLTHFLFTYTGVVSRWVELPPFPHGIIVFVALAIGLIVSNFAFVDSIWWFLVMGIGGATLFASAQGNHEIFSAEVEFAGGIMLAIYNYSSWMSTVRNTARAHNFGRGMVFGAVTYFILVLWSVYVVAYKFMEGGWILRERNISLTFATVLLSGLGHVTFSFFPRSQEPTRIPKNGFYVLLAVSAFVFGPIAGYRFQNFNLKPSQAPTNIKTLVWAIHFGYDNYGGTNIPDLGRVMKENNVNIVGMVETDASRIVMENRDIVEYLAEDLHFYSDFGSSTAQNTWGCGLLSQFPIVKSDRIVLPSPEGELACLIDAYVQVNSSASNSELVNVIVTHFGNTEDTLDLDLQSAALAKLVASKRDKGERSILIGYLTSEPYHGHWNRIIQSGLQDTIDSYDRYCLYSLYHNLQFQDFYRVDKGDISDTEAQVATFAIPNSENEKKLAGKHSEKTCQELIGDVVNCQANTACGWCETLTRGSCYTLEYADGCKAANATWVGKHIPSGESEEISRKKFVEKQYQNQLQLRSPVQVENNQVTWTVQDFVQKDYLFQNFYSAIFEAKGSYWKIRVEVPRKRGHPSVRGVGVYVIPAVGNKAFSGQISLQHPTDTSRVITKSGGWGFCTVQDLAYHSSFDSFKIVLKF
eukprot:TRINITY_DN4202_c0_g1_i1.p1 TRINITY_DN4202_c0_g1~~TRINITY_DN4202_c0_g1_i1.p1  ORF type:complete len:850 (+),score=258.44 TRINITY_DN4202_c0_g1_i1:113-2662(+)